MKLLYYELRKLLSKPVFLLLVLFTAAVLWVRFFMNCDQLDYVDRAMYRSVKKEMEALPAEEALLRLQRDRDGLMLLSFQKIYGETEEGQELFRRQFSGIAERYGMSLADFLSEYDAYAADDEERQKLQSVFNTLGEQYNYRESYHEFITDLPEQAEELSSISVFSHAGSFSYRSIQKSLRDYLSLGETEIRPDYDQGVKAIGSDDTSILFVFVLVLGAAVILFSEEEENGLRKLLFTTAKGRAELAAVKWGALLFFSAIFVVFLYGGEILIAGTRLGFGDITRSIQSVSDFRDCVYQIGVGGYLIMSVLLPMTAALIFSSLTTFLFIFLKKPWLAAGAAAIFAGGNYLFYRLLSENAALNTLKFVNLFGLSDVSARFSSYCNINFFGFPVSVLPTVLAAGAFLLIAGGLFSVLCFSKRIGLNDSSAFRFRRKIRIHGSVRIFAQENYRLYIGAFGVLVIGILLILGYRKTERGEWLLSNADYLYYTYGEEIAGEITDETDVWIIKKQEELSLEASGGIAEDAELTDEERMEALFAAQIKSREIEEKQRVLMRIQEEVLLLETARSKGIPVHYISKIQTDPIYNNGNAYLFSALLVFLILCFTICPMFSQDEESGMERLVRTVKFGRNRIFFTRYLVILLFYTGAFLLFFFPYVINVLKTYRMTDWEAPLQSVIRYVHTEGNMTLRGFSVLWILGSYVSGTGFVFLMAFLSRACRKNSTTMIVSAVIIAADFLVNLIGFPVMSSLALSSGFGVTEILARSGRTWVIPIILLKNAGITAVVMLLHRRVFTQ